MKKPSSFDGSIPNNSVDLFLSNMDISSNHGAHEFGHILSYAADPQRIARLGDKAYRAYRREVQ